MEFPGGSDNYLAITGAAHPFLTGAETFHTPSLGDEEFEIPPIALDADPSLAVADVVGHFEDLGEAGGAAEPPFPPPPYGVQGLEMPVGMGHGLMEQGGGLLAGGLAMPAVTIDVPMAALSRGGCWAPPLTSPPSTSPSSPPNWGLGLGGRRRRRRRPPRGGGGPPGGRPQPDPAPRRPPPPPPPPRRGSPPPPRPPARCRRRSLKIFGGPRPPSPPRPPCPPPPPPGEGTRRGKPPKKPKKKKDPNEPQKPVSAYALFFRDTQAAIKGQNPNATFGDVSKIVASMWDSLGEEQKQVYKRKTEAAKKEYLKALNGLPRPADLHGAAGARTQPPRRPHQPVPPPSSSPPSSSSPDPPPVPAPAPAAPSPNPTPPPPLTKIIIPKQMLPPSLTVAPQSGGVVTVIPATVGDVAGGDGGGGGGGGGRFQGAAPVHFAAGTPPKSSPRSVLQGRRRPAAPPAAPPPSNKCPPRSPPPQQVTVLQPPPPPAGHAAAPRPPKSASTSPRTPPPLQIKILPPPTLQITPLHLPPTKSGGGLPPPRPPPPPPNPTAPQIPAGAASPSETVEVMGGRVPEVESPPPLAVELVAESPAPADSPRPRCVRAGCANAPVASSDWDEEYCSSECVVKHCRDVFLAWLAARNAGNSVVFVK
ncbi:LOW QUALITY PROTEIN: TOX high mobility group box family member 4 [Chlamydotis macqueenii]